MRPNGCTGTLARSREKHLRLQPDHPIGVHHRCGCGVGQAHQVLPLLLLHDTRQINNTILCVCRWQFGEEDTLLTLWTSSGMTYLRTSG